MVSPSLLTLEQNQSSNLSGTLNLPKDIVSSQQQVTSGTHIEQISLKSESQYSMHQREKDLTTKTHIANQQTSLNDSIEQDPGLATNAHFANRDSNFKLIVSPQEYGIQAENDDDIVLHHLPEDEEEKEELAVGTNGTVGTGGESKREVVVSKGKSQVSIPSRTQTMMTTQRSQQMKHIFGHGAHEQKPLSPGLPVGIQECNASSQQTSPDEKSRQSPKRLPITPQRISSPQGVPATNPVPVPNYGNRQVTVVKSSHQSTVGSVRKAKASMRGSQKKEKKVPSKQVSRQIEVTQVSPENSIVDPQKQSTFGPYESILKGTSNSVEIKNPTAPMAPTKNVSPPHFMNQSVTISPISSNRNRTKFVSETGLDSKDGTQREVPESQKAFINDLVKNQNFISELAQSPEPEEERQGQNPNINQQDIINYATSFEDTINNPKKKKISRFLRRNPKFTKQQQQIHNPFFKRRFWEKSTLLPPSFTQNFACYNPKPKKKPKNKRSSNFSGESSLVSDGVPSTTLSGDRIKWPQIGFTHQMKMHMLHGVPLGPMSPQPHPYVPSKEGKSKLFGNLMTSPSSGMKINSDLSQDMTRTGFNQTALIRNSMNAATSNFLMSQNKKSPLEVHFKKSGSGAPPEFLFKKENFDQHYKTINNYIQSTVSRKLNSSVDSSKARYTPSMLERSEDQPEFHVQGKPFLKTSVNNLYKSVSQRRKEPRITTDALHKLEMPLSEVPMDSSIPGESRLPSPVDPTRKLNLPKRQFGTLSQTLIPGRVSTQNQERKTAVPFSSGASLNGEKEPSVEEEVSSREDPQPSFSQYVKFQQELLDKMEAQEKEEAQEGKPSRPDQESAQGTQKDFGSKFKKFDFNQHYERSKKKEQKKKVKEAFKLADLNVNLTQKSPEFHCEQLAKQILCEKFNPLSSRKNKSTSPRQRSAMGSPSSSLFESFRKVQSHTPEHSQMGQQSYVSNIRDFSPDAKLEILRICSQNKQKRKIKSLYDFTTQHIKQMRRKDKSRIERNFDKTTLLIPEQEFQRLRKSTGVPEGVGFPRSVHDSYQANWVRTQTIYEQRQHQVIQQQIQSKADEISPQERKRRMSLMLREKRLQSPILESEFKKQQRLAKKPLSETLEEDEQRDSQELLKFKKKYNDEYLYCQRIRSSLDKDDINHWRNQMKDLEDQRQYRRLYDRIGRESKSLLQERKAAQEDVLSKPRRKYQIINNEQEEPLQDYYKRLAKSNNAKFKIPSHEIRKILEQNLLRQSYAITCLELKRRLKSTKQKVSSMQAKRTIKLHPLQREQELQALKEERANLEIMRDFQVGDQRAYEILDELQDDFKEVDEMIGKRWTRLMKENETVKSGRADKLFQSLSAETIKSHAVSQYEEKQGISRSTENERKKSEDPPKKKERRPSHFLGLGQKAMGILKQTKIDLHYLEDEIVHHNHLVQSGGFEKMAKDELELKRSISKMSRMKKESEPSESEVSKPGLKTFMAATMGSEIRYKINKQKRKKTEEERIRTHELWVQVLSDTSQLDIINLRSGAGGQEKKRVDPRKQSLIQKRLEAQKLQKQLQRGKIRQSKEDRLFQANTLTDVFFNQSKQPVRRKSKEMLSNEQRQLQQLGSDKTLVMNLVKDFHQESMSATQIQQIIRFFTQRTRFFVQLKLMIVEFQKKRQGSSNDYFSTQIRALHLDDDFLAQMLSEQVCEIQESVNLFRESHGNEVFLYYIFEGRVCKINFQTKQIAQCLPEGNFFQVCKESQQQWRFQEATDAHFSMPTTGEKMNQVLYSARPTFLKFKMTNLLSLFKQQINAQIHYVFRIFGRFSIFNHLSRDDLLLLSSAEQGSFTQIQDFLPNEIILEEGEPQMGYLYLVVQGTVRMEKRLSIKPSLLKAGAKKGSAVQKVVRLHDTRCHMGDIKTYEMFGLKEMLESLKAYQQGSAIPVKPSPCRYVAKDHQAKREGDRLKGVGGIPTETVRIIKVKYEDYLKLLPAKVIEKWIAEQSRAGKPVVSGGGPNKKSEITQQSYQLTEQSPLGVRL